MDRALGALALGCLLLWLRSRRAARAESDGGYTTREGLFLELGRLRAELLRWLTTTNHREIGIL